MTVHSSRVSNRLEQLRQQQTCLFNAILCTKHVSDTLEYDTTENTPIQSEIGGSASVQALSVLIQTVQLVEPRTNLLIASPIGYLSTGVLVDSIMNDGTLVDAVLSEKPWVCVQFNHERRYTC